jgi:hypothetical protein
MTLAKQMLRTWIHTPLNFRLFKKALGTLGPVRRQFRHSFYIFCFHLPYPFSNFFATFGNYWFLRILHSLGKGQAHEDENLIGRLDPKDAGEAMATSTGPGTLQCTGSMGKGSLRYGESVRKRVGDRGMSQKVGIYRDGLFIGNWEKSLETTAALFEIATVNGSTPHSSVSSARPMGSAPEGSLKAPTTFMLGELDPAFDQQLALSNVKDFLAGGSQVVLVKDAGHWLPLETSGRIVVEKTVSWALSGETKSSPFAAMSDIKLVVET